mmetsp:Transcript_3584/g.6227  ORF Transcript_3584/g.6227 Transcript_3584/m.6227 type:complete len:214 (-) Transcript_3584:35-676(-)
MSGSDKHTFQRISTLIISIRSQGNKYCPFLQGTCRTSSMTPTCRIGSCTCADEGGQSTAHQGIVVQWSRPESGYFHLGLRIVAPVIIAGMDYVLVLVFISKINATYRPRRLRCYKRKSGWRVSNRHGIHSIAIAVSPFGRLHPPRDAFLVGAETNTTSTHKPLCFMIRERKDEKGQRPESDDQDGQANNEWCINGKTTTPPSSDTSATSSCSE